MKKGLSLPINALVLIALVVIVLLALVGSFIWPIRGSGEGADCQAKLQNGCNMFVMRGGCEGKIANYDDCPTLLKEGLACTQAPETLAGAEDTCC